MIYRNTLWLNELGSKKRLYQVFISKETENEILSGYNQDKERRNKVQAAADIIMNRYFGNEDTFCNAKEDVLEIQSLLVELGFNIGGSGQMKNGVDGVFGKKTRDALNDFVFQHSSLLIDVARPKTPSLPSPPSKTFDRSNNRN